MQLANEANAARLLASSDATRVLKPGWRLGALCTARDGRAVWEVESSAGRYMARFAPAAERARLEREQRLARFMEFLPVEVPVLTLHDAGEGFVIALRARIEGHTVGRDRFDAEFSEDDHARFVADVASLLRRMHETPLADACRSCGLPVLDAAAAAGELGGARWFDAEQIAASSSAVRAALPRIDALWSETCDWMAEFRPEPWQMVFGHGDLHGGNLLVRDNRLVALLDLEEAGIVHLYDEFLRLYLLDLPSGRRIAAAYQELPGQTRPIDDAAVLRFLRAFLFYLISQSRHDAYTRHCVGLLEASLR
jgi:aminoglycoside phosphotransferase (APT) family kinase protein